MDSKTYVKNKSIYGNDYTTGWSVATRPILNGNYYKYDDQNWSQVIVYSGTIQFMDCYIALD